MTGCPEKAYLRTRHLSSELKRSLGREKSDCKSLGMPEEL